MAKGDLLYYTGTPGSPVCNLIIWRTHGPFVHVEVDMGDGTAVGALTSGVNRHPLVPTLFRCPLSARGVSEASIDDGLAYLEAIVEAHDAYGWTDIVAAALPRWWRLLIDDTHAYDCSHLAFTYALRVGGIKKPPTWALSDPQAVSPNDLARMCPVAA